MTRDLETLIKEANLVIESDKTVTDLSCTKWWASLSPEEQHILIAYVIKSQNDIIKFILSASKLFSNMKISIDCNLDEVKAKAAKEVHESISSLE